METSKQIPRLVYSNQLNEKEEMELHISFTFMSVSDSFNQTLTHLSQDSKENATDGLTILDLVLRPAPNAKIEMLFRDNGDRRT